jgi:hypothetical protein
LFRLTCVEVIIFYILLIDALGANLVVHFGSKWYVQHFRAISRASSARTMTLSFSKTGKQRQNSGMSLRRDLRAGRGYRRSALRRIKA